MKKFWTFSLATTALLSMTACADNTNEIMATAGQNTLLGMGVVFVVLIFISFVISLFQFLPNGEKKTKKQEAKEVTVDHTIAQIAEKEEAAEEDLADDLALVAVISAAIAAYEGSATTEGFVVRAIKKSKSSNWRNA